MRLVFTSERPVSISLGPSLHVHRFVFMVCLYSSHSTLVSLTATDNSDGYLPRVNICSDGSYCCDNDPYCCVDKAGLFLSKDGEVIGYANQTTTTSAKSTATSTSSTSSTSSLASVTSSATQTSTSDSNTSSGLSGSAKVDVGVGAGVGGLALILLALFWFFYRRRQRKKAAADPQPYPPLLPGQTQATKPDNWFQLDSVSRTKPDRPAELAPTQLLAELPVSSESPAELPDNQT